MEREPSANQDILQKNLTRRQFLKLSLVAAAIASTRCDINLDTLIPSDPQIVLPQIYQRQPLAEKIKGVNFPSWYQGEYQKNSAIQSLENTNEISPNLVGIIPTLHQQTIRSTDIQQTENTATDEDLRFIIQKTHSLGHQVMLKPHVILSKDPSHWHGQIGQNFTEAQWKTWFISYQNMINHYAQLAEELNVELFVVGNEFRYSAINRAKDWVATIQGIRSKYSGPLTYAGHMEDFQTLTWWSQLDFLGLNPYFSLSQKLNPSLPELQTVWKGIATQVEKTAKKWNKQLIFPEIGYPSVRGAAKQPYNFNLIGEATVDLQQQANCYQAMYEAVWGKDWLRGIIVWDWNIDPTIGGLKNGDYTARNKPAAKIITKYHSIP